MAEAYVFISYSRQDLPFVERLGTDLRAAGVRIWRDTEQLRPGEQWQGAIENALTAAEALLYVASKYSRGSGWIDAELRGGLLSRRTIVPIILDDAGENELPTFLRQYQWVDFRGDYAQALNNLVQALPSTARSTTPVAQLQDKSKGYVFISYSTNDGDFVDNLRRFLLEHGYGYWDYAQSDRNYHTQFVRELEGVISAASATLSILSEAWKDSTWALREYIFSEEVGTPVFLLKAKEMGPSLAVAGTPYIDFTEDQQTAYQRLDDELKRKGL